MAAAFVPRVIFAFALLVSASAVAEPPPAPPSVPTPSGEPGVMPVPTPTQDPAAAAPPIQVKAPPTEPADSSDEISLEDWSRDDWMLIKPKVSLIDIDGYFRLRGDLFRRMDFGNASKWEVSAAGQPVARYPGLSDGGADFTDTNMRLRIEPRINITEQAQVITTIDLLDNLVLGSTPDSMTPRMLTTPVHLVSRSQQVPRRGENALIDAIAVKRLWGRVTALNEQLELRFGRMPDHFGMGMLYNNGDCLDCDYGTVADRIALSFRLYNHVFSPMVDWVSRGPQIRPFGRNDPRPLDAVAWDDVLQYALRVSREDHPDDIRDTTGHGSQVVNYGMSNAFRVQARDWATNYYNNETAGYDPNVEPTASTPYERRDAFLYVGDIFGRFYKGNFQLDVEVAVEAGSFKDTQVNATEQVTSIVKMGGAMEAKYHLRGDYRGVALSLKGGGASGDYHAGYGALDAADTQRGAGNNADLALHNFQFSPDYHLDLLMFRRIIGAVTDAWYVRPEVSYRFDEKFMARVNGVYSQTLRLGSTPSARNGGPAAGPMGVEFDGELSYGMDTNLERGQFLAALYGGVLFPLGAFNNNELAQNQQGGSFAWTVQARVALTF